MHPRVSLDPFSESLLLTRFSSYSTFLEFVSSRETFDQQLQAYVQTTYVTEQ